MEQILQAIKVLFRKTENKIDTAIKKVEQAIPKKLTDLENDLVISDPDWTQIKNKPFENKNELITDVLNALPTWTGGSY